MIDTITKEEVTEAHIAAVEAHTGRKRNAWGLMPPADLIAGVCAVMADGIKPLENECEPIEFDEADCLALCEDKKTGEAFVCSLPQYHYGPCQTKSETGEILSDGV